MRKLRSSGRVIVCAVLIAAISQLYVTTGDGQSGGDCKGCHSGKEAGRLGLKDVYADIAGYKVSHEGIEKECAGCHILQKGLNAGTVRESGASDYQTKAVFFLSGLSMDRRYNLVLGFEEGRGGRSSASSLKFRPYEVTPRPTPLGVGAPKGAGFPLPRSRPTLRVGTPTGSGGIKTVLSREGGDGKPPLARNVRVASVTKKVFLDAVVQWESDEPSAGFIEYGSGGAYSERVFFEDVFETRRSVSIPGLRSGVYGFRIISRDIFGNASVSGEYKLDSSKSYEAIRVAKAGSGGVPAQSVGRAKPEVRVFRLDSTGDVYVEVLSVLPVKASLKLTEEIEIGSHGTGLSPGRFSRIDACRACHPQDASHPVAIRSSGASVRVPGDMPTIEGGLLTCVTCHYPHGGADYFSRFDGERELCEKCHKGGLSQIY